VALLVYLAREPMWRAATSDRAYRPPSLTKEGFIHLWRPQEPVTVANLVFRDVDGRHPRLPPPPFD
jgi:uncharacterized protein (DUF952 family)